MHLDEGELRRLIAQGEGRELEFKRGLPRDRKPARTLCAFANTCGGILLVGVTDKGEVYGVPRPREVVARLRAVCAEEIEPALAPHVRALRLDGRHVVCCAVALSPARPHAVRRDGEPEEIVVRVGSSNRRAGGATLAALRVPRSRAGLDPLQKRILAWVEERTHGAPPGGASVREFATAQNIGLQRARRAFVQLERAGRLVAHGRGAERRYAPA
jgi:hypothetical protein